MNRDTLVELKIDEVCDAYEGSFRKLGYAPAIDSFVASFSPSLMDWLQNEDHRNRLFKELMRLKNALDEHPSRRDGISETDAKRPQPTKSLQQSGRSMIGDVWNDSLEQYQAGDQLGSYRLENHIGTGGMGTVWKATQITPVVRTVAIKFIQQRSLDPYLLSRFRSECQSLAALDHPNIACMFEANQSGDGRPYLVMEYVDGGSITEFASAHHLTLLQRIELFVPICRAVQHAHQKGIIHRDLKPSNLLVTKKNDRIVAKIIDFGLAKINSDGLDLRSLHTMVGQVIGTLDYMSPEQTRMGEIDIDTRSDIYSLGAVLYELLTGKRPLADYRLKDLPIEQALSLIRNQDPRPPSKLSKATSSMTAAERSKSGESVPLNVRMELDWIVGKCLDKDRTRRYDSATALADDLERYLRHEPVLAAPPSLLYRGQKLVHRHWIASSAIALASILLLLSMIGVYLANASWKSRELVSALLTARSESLLPLIQEIDARRSLTHPKLRNILAESDEKDSDLADADEKESFSRSSRSQSSKVNALLALAYSDSSRAQEVYQSSFHMEIAFLPVVQAVLDDKGPEVREYYWQTLENAKSDREARFRSGLILAGIDAKSERWSNAICNWFSLEMIRRNPESQPLVRQLIRPIAERLLPHWEILFRSQEIGQTEAISMANAVSDFAKNDPPFLAQCLIRSNPNQFEILFPRFKDIANRDAIRIIEQKLDEEPTEEMTEPARVRLGRERAIAAFVMVRLGMLSDALRCLEVKDDYEAATQFSNRCKEYGIAPTNLLRCLEICEARDRTSTSGGKVSSPPLYSLLLALGEFPLEAFENEQSLLHRIAGRYRDDPRASIHAASGWLLTQWGQVPLRREVDLSEVPYSPGREWFNLAISPRINYRRRSIPKGSKAICTTMIVVPPGTLEKRSSDLPIHPSGAPLRLETIPQPFAISEREITWEDFDLYDGRAIRTRREKDAGRPFDSDEPLIGTNWDLAMHYCGWLTDQSRAMSADKARGIDFSKTRIRLPTESEWEFAVRRDVVTTFSFGSDRALLVRYGWIMENSDGRGHPVKRLRPNPFGLFDTVGNNFEFCLDILQHWQDQGLTTLDVFKGARVLKGGDYDSNLEWCRPTTRVTEPPHIGKLPYGFRIAMTLPTQIDANEELELEQ